MAELIEKLRKLEGELREGCWDQDADTCREAAALARRVEDAPVATMDKREFLSLCAPTWEDFPALYALQGKRVRLVPEAGQGGGE